MWTSSSTSLQPCPRRAGALAQPDQGGASAIAKNPGARRATTELPQRASVSAVRVEFGVGTRRVSLNRDAGVRRDLGTEVDVVVRAVSWPERVAAHTDVPRMGALIGDARLCPAEAEEDVRGVAVVGERVVLDQAVGGVADEYRFGVRAVVPVEVGERVPSDLPAVRGAAGRLVPDDVLVVDSFAVEGVAVDDDVVCAENVEPQGARVRQLRAR